MPLVPRVQQVNACLNIDLSHSNKETKVGSGLIQALRWVHWLRVPPKSKVVEGENLVYEQYMLTILYEHHMSPVGIKLHTLVLL